MDAWAGIKIHRSVEPRFEISFRSNESRRDFVLEAMLRTLASFSVIRFLRESKPLSQANVLMLMFANC